MFAGGLLKRWLPRWVGGKRSSEAEAAESTPAETSPTPSLAAAIFPPPTFVAVEREAAAVSAGIDVSTYNILMDLQHRDITCVCTSLPILNILSHACSIPQLLGTVRCFSRAGRKTTTPFEVRHTPSPLPRHPLATSPPPIYRTRATPNVILVRRTRLGHTAAHTLRG